MKPTTPGKYFVRSEETENEWTEVEIKSDEGWLIVHDKFIGCVPLDHYHDNLINIEWKKAIEPINKTYTIKFNIFEDGSKELSRTNDGFDAFELLGILAMAQAEVLECLKGSIKPDIIKRSVVK